jgi:hypothetical protein
MTYAPATRKMAAECESRANLWGDVVCPVLQPPNSVGGDGLFLKQGLYVLSQTVQRGGVTV